MNRESVHLWFKVSSAIAGFIPLIFIILITISTLLNPGYDHLRSTLSRLAIESNYSWIARVAISIYGASYFFISWPLYHILQSQNQKKSAYSVCILLLFVSFFSLMTGLIPDDVDRGGIFVIHSSGGISISGIIHDVSSRLSFICGITAISIFSAASIRYEKNRWFPILSILTVFIMLIVGGIFTITIMLPYSHWLWNWIGIFQKVIVLSSVIWIQIISIRLFITIRSGEL